MKTKIIVFFLMLFLFCSCSRGKKENIKLSIFQYPDRIVYIKDIDDCLDLKGGVLEFTTESNVSRFLHMDQYYYSTETGSSTLELSTDVDFHKEGTYTVTFSYKDISTSFPIIVIDQNYIKDRTAESE